MRIHEKRRWRGPKALAALAFAVVLAACGGDAGGGDAGGGSGGGGMSVSVTEPAANAAVTTPFTVKINSSEPLGAEDTGRHHVHIWFDDNENDYLIVESDTTQVKSAPSGAHTMHVSLRNADHSEAGAEVEVPITIGGSPGAPPPSGGQSNSPPNDGYDY